MKKLLFLIPLAMIVLASCSKSTPAEQAVAIFNDAEQAVSKAKSFDDIAEACIAMAAKAQKFFDENGKDWKPAADELKGIQEAETNCNKAMAAKLDEIMKNSKEEESFSLYFAMLGKLADIDKKFPDAKNFSFLSAFDADESAAEFDDFDTGSVSIDSIDADSAL